MIESFMELSPAWSTVVCLGGYIALCLFGRVVTGQMTVGILMASSIPALNLVAYTTGWLVPEFKPFMPLWITLLLIVLPFLYAIIRHADFDTHTESSRD